MRCEGLSNGPGPHNASGDKVHFRYVELNLCSPCEKEQKRATTLAAQEKAKSTSKKENNENQGAGKVTGSAIVRNKDLSGISPIHLGAHQLVEARTSETIILDPVLAYIMSSMQNSSQQLIHKAVTGYYMPQQISEAKETLWEKCGDILDKKPRRVTSSTRPDYEANFQDIFIALEKLDKLETGCPIIAVNALLLNSMPKSCPEELNNIMLLDRPNEFERKLSDLQLCTDKLTAKNMEIKLNIIRSNSYAAKVQSNHYPGTSVTKKGCEGQLMGDYALPPPVSRVNRVVGLYSSKAELHRTPMPLVKTCAVEDTDNLTTSQMASCEGKSNQGNRKEPDSFTFPKKKKRSTVIVGKGSSSASIKSAPEPSRDVFLYQIDNATDEQNIVDYLTEKNITARQVTCMSKHESAFKSNFQQLLDLNLWPEGVRIRKFYQSKQTTKHGLG